MAVILLVVTFFFLDPLLASLKDKEAIIAASVAENNQHATTMREDGVAAPTAHEETPLLHKIKEEPPAKPPRDPSTELD